MAKKGEVNIIPDRAQDCNTNVSSNNCRKGFKNNQGLGVNKLFCKKENTTITKIYLIKCSALQATEIFKLFLKTFSVL